jgi:pantoate--beta-alanine ligase
MEVVYTIKDVHHTLRKIRRVGKKIGLVPTMGALHAGHGSLIWFWRGFGEIPPDA